jgi:hypothetical protein
VATNATDFESTAVARAGDSPIKWRPPTRIGKTSPNNVLRPGIVIVNGDTNLVVINVNGNGRLKAILNATWASGQFTLLAKIRQADHLNDIGNVWLPQTVSSPVGSGGAQDVVIEVPQIEGAAYVELSLVNGSGVSVTVNQVDVFIADEALQGVAWRDSTSVAGVSGAAPAANTNITGSLTVVEGGVYDLEANVGFGSTADTQLANFTVYKTPVGGAAAQTGIKFAAPGAVNTLSPAQKARICLQPGDVIFIGNPLVGGAGSIYTARLAATKIS